MKSISDLTVGQYQHLWTIHKSDLEDIEKITESVAVLTGKTPRQVDDMALTEFNAIAHKLGEILSVSKIPDRPKKRIKVRGKTYRIVYSIRRELTAGQYIDLQTFMKGDHIDNLHKIMACLCLPIRPWRKARYDGARHEEISEALQDAKFVDVYPACVFFSKLWTVSIKAMEGYLTRELVKEKVMSKGQAQKIMAVLQQLTDGSLTQK